MWFFGVDAKKSWVVLSASLGGSAFPSGGPLLRVRPNWCTPASLGKSSREAVLSAVMDDLVIVLANKD